VKKLFQAESTSLAKHQQNKSEKGFEPKLWPMIVKLTLDGIKVMAII